MIMPLNDYIQSTGMAQERVWGTDIEIFAASSLLSTDIYVYSNISLSHAMRPGLQIRHFWVAKSLFLTIIFNQKKHDKTFCFLNNC